jgi:hypothetical protein
MLVILFQALSARAGERIVLFSDEALTNTMLTDTSPRIVDVYVAHLETPGTTGCLFRIAASPGFTGVWLGDSSPWYTAGNSQAGITVVYEKCLAGNAVMLKVTYQLFGTSANCSSLRTTNHPITIPGQVYCDRCFSEYSLPESSLLINCTVATESTTWGRVKALYRD